MSNYEIYVINLARSQKRLNTMSTVLQAYKQTFNRVEAVDGDFPDTLSQSTYCEHLNAKRYHKPLGKGEIACVESHKRALNTFLKSNLSCALILEDDAVPSYPSLFEDLDKIASTNQDWDVVKLYLGKKAKRISASVRISERLAVGIPQKVPNSNLAQLVSRQGAEKILQAYSKYGEPADITLKQWWRYKLRILAVDSPVFQTADIASDIDSLGSRKGAKKSRIKRIWQKICYEFKNAFNQQSHQILTSLRNIK